MSIQRRDGRRGASYRVRVRYKDPVTKKWQTVSGGTFTSLKEARVAERKLQTEVDGGIAANASGQSLRKYLEDRWLPAVSRVSKRGRPLAPTTRTRYEHDVRTVAAVVGDVKLRDLRPFHIEALRDTLLAQGRLAPQTVADTMRVLSQALRRAKAWGLIAYNPADADLVDRPTGESHSFTIITPELGQRILQSVKGLDPWDVAANLALGVGLRREEVLGLTWSNVDLVSGVLTVSQTLTYADGKRHFGPPKSNASARDLQLPDFVLESLKRHRAAQARRGLAAGLALGDQDLVVHDGEGNSYLPASFSKRWARFAKASGFADVRFHGLRHGTATLLLAAGVPDAVAAKILGHSDTRVLKRYQDVIPDLHRDAAARMDALFMEG